MNNISVNTKKLHKAMEINTTRQLLKAMSDKIDYLYRHNKNLTNTQYAIVDDLSYMINTLEEVKL